VRFAERPQRPIRTGSWHRGQNAGPSKGAKAKEEEKKTEDIDTFDASAVATATTATSLGLRRDSSLEDPLDKAVKEDRERIVERLWKEGRCKGRQGKVRCDVTEDEYIVQVDGLVPSPYATSLYLSGCRCLKINGEMASGAEEFHETVDFPESAKINEMTAKWNGHKLVVHVPKKQEMEEAVDTGPTIEGSRSSSRACIDSEGLNQVASAGDVPLPASRRTGTIALEDVEI